MLVRAERPLLMSAAAVADRHLRAQRAKTGPRALWRFSGCDLTRSDGVSAGTAQIVLTEIGAGVPRSLRGSFRFLASALHARLSMAASRSRSAGTAWAPTASRERFAWRLRPCSAASPPFGAAFGGSAHHKGGAVAVVAIARKLARLIYRMLRYGQDHVDIGEKAYKTQFKARRLASHKEAARGLGSPWSRSPHAEG